MGERTRERVINIRVTEDEERMAKAVADHQGLSVSDIIRQFIRRAFAEAFPAKRSKK